MEAGDVPLAQSFNCGVPALNEWLQKYAWQNHNSGGARVYLSIDQDANQIAGYFCLSAASVDHKSAPTRVTHGLAKHEIPVALIGRLGVDQHYHGRNLGRFLVLEAFRRVLEVADTMGVRAVIVVAKDDDAAEFYKRLGFEASIDNPGLFFITLKDAKKSRADAQRSPTP
jgi:GNAT superfamily N-acetyltransferase